MNKIDNKEQEYRDMDTCIVCKQEKSAGLIVCWDCYKYREDMTPFKYYKGTIEDYIKESEENK